MEVAGGEQAGAMVVKPARGVRQGDVDRAADAILARGERPTVERIRGLLKTGSPNTLSPLIDNWYRSLSARVAGMQHAGGGEGRAPTAAVNAFNLLWDTALSEARSTVQAELSATREQLARDRSAIAEDQRVLEATRAALDQAAQAARDHTRELEGQVVAAQQLMQRAQNVAAAADERAAKLQQDLTQAHREIKDLAASHEEHMRREAERAGANERRMLADVDGARLEGKSALEDLRRAQSQREEQQRAATELRDHMQARLDALARLLAQREEDLARAHGASARAAAVEVSLQELVATAHARTDDLLGALESERAVSSDLRKQVNELIGIPSRRRVGTRPAASSRLKKDQRKR